MSALHRARRLAQRFGLDVRPFPRDDLAYRRVLLLRHFGIDHVVDVGASDGRYGSELRRFGYEGRITSFEPLTSAYSALHARAARDPLWTALPYAIGDARGEAELHVANNAGASSSMLPMLPTHEQAAPAARYIATQRVTRETLESLESELRLDHGRPFLKLDVQGYEAAALAGARNVLHRFAGVQIELSFVPLYEGALTYREAIDEMVRLGLTLMSLEPGFTDRRTGQLFQADATFLRQHVGGSRAQ